MASKNKQSNSFQVSNTATTGEDDEVNQQTGETAAVEGQSDETNGLMATEAETVAQDAVIEEPVAESSAKESVAEADEPQSPSIALAGLRIVYTDPELIDLIGRVFATGDAVAIGVIQDFDSYAFEMARGRSITGPDASMNQMKIFRAIQTMLLSLDEHFTIVFATVLKMIESAGEYGVFSGAAVYRFGDISRLRTSEQEAYLDIWNMLIVLAPVKGRKQAIGLIDLNRPFRQSFSDLAKRRVLSFLGM